jgi:hypothetical protein
MEIQELLTDIELSEKQVWARAGKAVVRKYRCSGGKRHGRVVSSMSKCYAPINIKKRLDLRKTKAKQGKRMTRKSLKTKRINPASKRVQRLNKH